LFSEKKILLLGPSKQALFGFDYSLMDKYDFVVRTNKFLEASVESDKSRCDVLFINSNCVRFYCQKGVDSLLGKIIFVKLSSEKKVLQDYDGRLIVFDVESEWHKLCKLFYPHIPYYGTVALSFLKDRCKKLDIAGMDFYKEGFSDKERYIEGYYDLPSTGKQESQHSINKDLMYTDKILNLCNNVELLYKTKQAFDEWKAKTHEE